MSSNIYNDALNMSTEIMQNNDILNYVQNTLIVTVYDVNRELLILVSYIEEKCYSKT